MFKLIISIVGFLTVVNLVNGRHTFAYQSNVQNPTSGLHHHHHDHVPFPIVNHVHQEISEIHQAIPVRVVHSQAPVHHHTHPPTVSAFPTVAVTSVHRHVSPNPNVAAAGAVSVFHHHASAPNPHAHHQSLQHIHHVPHSAGIGPFHHNNIPSVIHPPMHLPTKPHGFLIA